MVSVAANGIWDVTTTLWKKHTNCLYTLLFLRYYRKNNSHRNITFFSQIPGSLVSFVHISNAKLNGMSEIPGAVLDPKHKKDQCLLTRSSRRRVKAHKTWHTLYIYLAGLILLSVNFSIQYWVSDLCGKKKYILKCKFFFNQSKISI